MGEESILGRKLQVIKHYMTLTKILDLIGSRLVFYDS